MFMIEIHLATTQIARSVTQKCLFSFIYKQQIRPQRPLRAPQRKVFDFFFLAGREFLGGWWYLPPKQLKTYPGHMRSYIVRESHIGSVVSEIVLYRQTSFYLWHKSNRNRQNLLFLPVINYPDRPKFKFQLLDFMFRTFWDFWRPLWEK